MNCFRRMALLDQNRSSQQAWWISIIIVACLVTRIESKELPNSLYATTPFNNTVMFRQNVCHRQAMLNNESIALRNALEGLELRAVLFPSEYFQLDETTGGLEARYAGLIPDLLDQLADRAGFTWRNSYAVTTSDPTMYNQTWSDLLLWSTHKYDLSADWWVRSLPRVSEGIRFPDPWYDGSIIMVGKLNREEETTKFALMSWLKPFSYQVWIMIMVSIIFSALIYYILEGIDKKSDGSRYEKSFMENLYKSGMAFTSQFEFSPRTNAARMFTFSMSLWALVLVATYTANLASFLVVKNTPLVEINSVGDAVRFGMPMCIQASTQADEEVTSTYPNAKLIRKTNSRDIFLGVRNGECKVAISTVSMWDSFDRDMEVNGDCSLGWIGRTFQFLHGGFATISDSGTLCTSLITDALNVHLLEMKEDHSIEKSWTRFHEQSGNVNCQEMAEGQSEQESQQLTLQNLGGIFVVHYSMSLLAVLVAVVYRWKGWDQIPRLARYGPNSRKAVRQWVSRVSQSMTNRGDAPIKLDPRREAMLRAAQKPTVRDLLKGVRLRRLSVLENDPSDLELREENVNQESAENVKAVHSLKDEQSTSDSSGLYSASIDGFRDGFSTGCSEPSLDLFQAAVPNKPNGIDHETAQTLRYLAEKQQEMDEKVSMILNFLKANQQASQFADMSV